MKKEQVLEIITSNKSLFDYGEAIHEDTFRDMFKVEVLSEDQFKSLTKTLSKQQIKQQIEAEALAELSVSGVVKDILHSQGKHMSKHGQYYRIALPSENERIAQRYRSKAARAIAKAKKLTANTPHIEGEAKNTSKSLLALMA